LFADASHRGLRIPLRRHGGVIAEPAAVTAGKGQVVVSAQWTVLGGSDPDLQWIAG